MDEIEGWPPFLIYAALRAALVQGLNMIAVDGQMRQKSLGNLRICLSALRQMRRTWPAPGNLCLEFLRGQLKSWDLDVGE